MGQLASAGWEVVSSCDGARVSSNGAAALFRLPGASADRADARCRALSEGLLLLIPLWAWTPLQLPSNTRPLSSPASGGDGPRTRSECSWDQARKACAHAMSACTMCKVHAQDAATIAMFGPDSVIGTACRAFVITHYLPLSFAVALTIALAWPAPGIAALHVMVSALAAAATSSSSSHWLLQLSRQAKSSCGSSS